MNRPYIYLFPIISNGQTNIEYSFETADSLRARVANDPQIDKDAVEKLIASGTPGSFVRLSTGDMAVHQ